MIFDAIIIGGGAAGLMCAIEAGKRGRKVLLIEHNSEVGRKIIISGGGRCNFTNLNVSHENFISRNPHFCKSALALYTQNDFIALIEKHKIPFYEKTLGQLFCRDSSRSVLEMLLKECRDARVKIYTGCSVRRVRRGAEAKGTSLFELETNQGDFTCESLVIASGGLSFPKIGASDFGYRIAGQFDLKIEETRPSLVALRFKREKEFEGLASLSGVSFDAIASTNSHSFHEKILFTHRGLSGPAILQISNYWKRETEISIDLMPGLNLKNLLTENRARKILLDNLLSERLPARFAEEFVRRNFTNKPLNQLSEKEIKSVSEKLHDWNVLFKETEGYDRAEITLGGISTDELSSQTMEAKRVKGLYFIGEVVDVTGWLGGYNFQWAWSSGFACGQAV